MSWLLASNRLSGEIERGMRTFYEFFAGGGMVRAGLGPEWSCLFANDIDPKKAASYVANWGEESLRVEDVAAVAAADLPGIAALAWASFPCQDLSLAGSGAGLSGQRSGTFWPFWRLMESLARDGRAPTTIILENVCGALTSHQGADFAAIAGAIVGGGYRLGALVIDAAHFLPQSRARLFVIAVRTARPIARRLLLAEPEEAWHPPALLRAHSQLPAAARNRWLWWRLPVPAARNTELASLIEEKTKGTTSLISQTILDNRPSMAKYRQERRAIPDEEAGHSLDLRVPRGFPHRGSGRRVVRGAEVA